MSDWTESVVAKANMRANLLIAYDRAIAGGFTPEETRLMIQSAMASTPQGFMWAVYELWLDEDRPL